LTERSKTVCTPMSAPATRPPGRGSSWRFPSSRWTCLHSPRSQQEQTRRKGPPPTNFYALRDTRPATRYTIVRHTQAGAATPKMPRGRETTSVVPKHELRHPGFGVLTELAGLAGRIPCARRFVGDFSSLKLPQEQIRRGKPAVHSLLNEDVFVFWCAHGQLALQGVRP
jgi:hypothetical protein